MEKFRIRGSACSNIMTSPRKKDELISEGAKTYCKDWLKAKIYGDELDFNNKYTRKGNAMEDDAIDLVAETLDLGMLMKNEISYDECHEHIKGTPDIVLPDMVIDVKCSWSSKTFPAFETENTNKAYYYQAMCYMAITGRKKFKLAYCLLDAPFEEIESEAKKYSYTMGWGELTKETFEYVKSKMTYPNVPKEKRIKIFDIPYDQKVVDDICRKVDNCRTYIETLL